MSKIFKIENKLLTFISIISLISLGFVLTSCTKVDNKKQNDRKLSKAQVKNNTTQPAKKQVVEIANLIEFKKLNSEVLNEARNIIRADINRYNKLGDKSKSEAGNSYKVTHAQIRNIKQQQLVDDISGLKFLAYHLSYQIVTEHDVPDENTLNSKNNKVIDHTTTLVYTGTHGRLDYLGQVKQNETTEQIDNQQATENTSINITNCIELFEKSLKTKKYATNIMKIGTITGTIDVYSDKVLEFNEVTKPASLKVADYQYMKTHNLKLAKKVWAYLRPKEDNTVVDNQEKEINFTLLDKTEFLETLQTGQFKNKIFEIGQNEKDEVVSIVERYIIPTKKAEKLDKADIINNIVASSISKNFIRDFASTNNTTYLASPKSYTINKPQLIDSYDDIAKDTVYEIYQSKLDITTTINDKPQKSPTIYLYSILETKNSKTRAAIDEVLINKSETTPQHSKIVLSNLLKSKNDLKDNDFQLNQVLQLKDDFNFITFSEKYSKINFVDCPKDIPEVVKLQSAIETLNIANKINFTASISSTQADSSDVATLEEVKICKIKDVTTASDIIKALYKVEYGIKPIDINFINNLYVVTKTNGSLITRIKKFPNPYIVYEKNNKYDLESIIFISNENDLEKDMNDPLLDGLK